MTQFPDARILIVDDEPANVLLLEKLLARWGYVNTTGVTRSDEVPMLCETTPPPDLLLLDLHMPHPDGFEILRELEPQTRGGPALPVIVLTADITTDAKHRALAAGARDFLTKPFDHHEVQLRVSNVLETRQLQVQLQRRNQDLEARVQERTRDLELARLETLDRLAMAAEYRDDDTKEHTDRVGRSAGLLAELVGLPKAEVDAVRQAAALHDIGKIAIPDSVLLKPGRLTADEYELMKTHAVIGASMLEGSSSAILEVSTTIALSHHERWDGSGYPSGLAGAEIPLTGRLTAVADVFDALSHDRPYKSAWPVEEAVAEIYRQSGAHFDPEVVEAFRRLDPARLLAPIGGATTRAP